MLRNDADRGAAREPPRARQRHPRQRGCAKHLDLALDRKRRSGPSPGIPRTDQAPGIHARGRSDHGIGHRRKHGRLQPARRVAPPRAASQGSAPARLSPGRAAQGQTHQPVLLSDIRAFSRGEPLAGRPGRVRPEPFQCHHRWRSGNAPRRVRERPLLRHAGYSRRCGATLHCGRRCTRERSGGGDQRSLLGKSVRQGHLGRWQDRLRRKNRRNHRRRDATGIPGPRADQRLVGHHAADVPETAAWASRSRHLWTDRAAEAWHSARASGRRAQHDPETGFHRGGGRAPHGGSGAAAAQSRDSAPVSNAR